MSDWIQRFAPPSMGLRRGVGLLFTTLLASSAVALDAELEQSWTDDGVVSVPPTINGGVGAVITVGSLGTCDFDDLQAAIDSAGDGDRLQLMDETFSDNIQINSKSLAIVGGYPDCNAASSPGGRSTLDGGGAGLVVDVYYPAAAVDPVRRVTFENLLIQNGGGSGFSSGGVLVEGLPGRLETLFRNVQISDNERTGVDDDGAGLRIVTTDDAVSGGTRFAAMVALENDSTVLRNSAGGDGGGIHCSSDDDVETEGVTTLRVGTTLVLDNEAENGGGIAIDGCRNVFLYSGGPVVLIFPSGGIVGNTANTFGGGLYLDNAAEVFLRATEFVGFGDPGEAALLAGNTANFGGGASVRGGSRLVVQDSYVTGNTGTLFNGGIGVGTESELVLERNAGNDVCPEPVAGGGVLSRPPCSVVENNSSENVGGIGATTGALVDISRTIFRGNEATAAGGVSALRATGVATFRITEVRAEGLLVHDNIGDAVMEIQGVTGMNLLFSTVVDNSGDIVHVNAPAGQQAIFDVLASILRASDGASVLAKSGAGSQSTTASCVITNRSPAEADFDLSNFYSEIDGPLFRDAVSDDFRLGFRSPAIDYCNSASGTQFAGLDGGVRGTPWGGPSPDPNPSGSSGDYDLGAYERPWQIQSTDLAVEVVMADPFLDLGEGVSLDLQVANNGTQTAFGEIDVVDDFNTAQLTNQQWNCTPPAGVSCTPASGTGDVSTVISDLAPGQTVDFEVTADLADPNADLEFLYTMIVTESVFNFDSNAGNNDVLVEFTAGLFADSFESPPP